MSEFTRPPSGRIMITLAAFVIIVAGMSAAKVILVPFLLSVFIAIICAPLLFWLQRHKIPTWLALLLIIAGIMVIGLLVGSLVGSSLEDFSRNLPVYEARLQQRTAGLFSWLEGLGVDRTSLQLDKAFNPGSAVKLTATLLNGVGNAMANAFLILMTVIFILLEASGMPAKLVRALGGSETALERFSEFAGNVKHYMTIKTISSLGTGLLVYIMLSIMGVDYALLWGLLAFAFNYVPNIGSIIAALPVVLLTMIQLDLIYTLIVALGYLVINVLIGSVLEPRFMGRGLGLSTLVVFISLLFWGWVLGPIGMLLSVPLTITAKMALDSRDDTRWLAVLLGSDAAVATTGDREEGGPEERWPGRDEGDKCITRR